jgi:hypothetical protein
MREIQDSLYVRHRHACKAGGVEEEESGGIPNSFGNLWKLQGKFPLPNLEGNYTFEMGLMLA